MKISGRILHIEITESLGGIEIFLLNVYRNINRPKLQFDFVLNREEAEIEGSIKELGGRIFKVRYGNAISYYNRLVELILKNGYSVVHIHKNSAINIIPFLACKRAGVKTIIAHSHNTSPSKGRWMAKILHYINRPILNALSSDKFACSGLAAEWLFGKRYVRKNKVLYVKNGIEVDVFAYDAEIRSRIRAELKLQTSTFLIGNVGRMTRQKNQVFLVEVLFEVRKRYADTKLLICGNGTMKSEILKRAEELGVADSLILPGQCTNINEMLQAMDIYVMPSLYEGFGIAAVEAQCAGLPTILSDIIPAEAKITEVCKRISLRVPPSGWSMEIMKLKDIERKDVREIIRENGIDIKQTACFLQEYYMKKL